MTIAILFWILLPHDPALTQTLRTAASTIRVHFTLLAALGMHEHDSHCICLLATQHATSNCMLGGDAANLCATGDMHMQAGQG